MQKKIVYWSPCLNPVGTIKSTINSALSLNNYSKSKYEVFLINACGEWDTHKYFCSKNNIKIIDFKNKIFKYLPKKGFLVSRISYLIVICLSAIPLLKLLKKNKPDYIILHLLTSLPLILLYFFSFETKFILRISGHPKLNILRKSLWKLAEKKIFKITFPTHKLMYDFKKKKLFDDNKFIFLPDAIINMSEYRSKIKSNSACGQKDAIPKSFFLTVGRITKQKNYTYLINEYSKFSLDNKDIDLVIVGEGEEKRLLLNLVQKYKIEKRVYFFNYTDNVYFFMKKAKAFILSSLWEEVGFVIVESALSNLYIISSNCPNGPLEFLLNGKAGSIFTSNEKNELYLSLKKFLTKNDKELFYEKLLAKKQCKIYSIFNHYNHLKNILDN